MAAALLLKSRCNMGDRKRVNLEVLKVVFANHAAPVLWVTGEDGVLPRAAEPLQSDGVKGLFTKAAFQSVSGTCRR